jgi:hypothetical protein
MKLTFIPTKLDHFVMILLCFSKGHYTLRHFYVQKHLVCIGPNEFFFNYY